MHKTLALIRKVNRSFYGQNFDDMGEMYKYTPRVGLFVNLITCFSLLYKRSGSCLKPTEKEPAELPTNWRSPKVKCGGKLELKSLLLNNIDNKGFGISNVDRESKRLWAVTPSKNKIK